MANESRTLSRSKDLMRYRHVNVEGADLTFQARLQRRNVGVLAYFDADDVAVMAEPFDGPRGPRVDGVICETTLLDIVRDVIQGESNIHGAVDHEAVSRLRAVLEAGCRLCDHALKQPALPPALAGKAE